MQNNTNSLLEVKNLKVSFHTGNGKVRAINDISFSIDKGKILGIVGESGCGKSVTSLSIMGLLPPKTSIIEEGSITFKGTDLLTLSAKGLEAIRGNDISMIFQEPMTSLNPVFTIGHQIGEALKIHKGLRGKENKEKCIEMLKLVNIPSPEKVIDYYPHSLSGGMRQRVMIAMALCCSPSLLIADEPTTALDVTIQAQVLELMKEINSNLDTSILLITHDLGVIAEIADAVLVLYGGRVVEEASVAELFDNPKHPYTLGLLNSRLIAEDQKRLNTIKGIVPPLNDMPTGCAFSPRCSKCMDICKTKSPDLIEIAPEHKVRCWLYSEESV